jgi:uncharacterized delta-60 repeat protein
MKTYISDLTSIPDWLGAYGDQTGKTLDTDFGFDPDGMYFTGGANGEGPSAAYSVRTNFNIEAHQVCEVIFTVDHTDNCTDQGICFYNDGQSPNWDWNPNASRIAFQINCPTPYIYGTNKFVNNSGEYYGTWNPGTGGSDVLESGTYTFKVTYDPAARTVTAITYEGANTSGTVVETLVLHEKLMNGGPYRIGFDADADGDEISPGSSQIAYFKSLRINIYETNGIYSGAEGTLSNILDNLKSGYSQITDLVGSNLYLFCDDADLDDGSDPNFEELGIGNAICIDGNTVFVGGYSGLSDQSKSLRKFYYGNESESFTPPKFYANSIGNQITSIVKMSDGRLVVGGGFSSVERFDGASNSGSITFDADIDGNTSLGSSAGLNLPYDASIVETGWTVTFADSSTRTVTSSYFFTPTARWVVALDSPIAAEFPITIEKPEWNPTIDGNSVIIGGMVCLNPDGSISKRDGGDIGFEDRAISFIEVAVYDINLLGDDSVLVGGHFTHYDNVESPYLAKIDSDGVIDSAFAANVLSLALDGNVNSIAVDSNGKIFIGGQFTKHIIKLNADGTVDSSFDSGVGFSSNAPWPVGAYAILPLQNGKILIGHNGETYDESSCSRGIIRVTSTGSLDVTFDPDLYSDNDGFGGVLTIAKQNDGKILVGGYFDSVNGSSSSQIARLNSDGTLDTSFDVGFGFTPAGYNWAPGISDIKLDSDGNIYVAGSFTDYNHAARFQYAALDTNGALLDWSVLPAFKQIGIDDGMDDMYDGANFLNTNLTQTYLSIKCEGGNALVSGGEGGCSGNHEKSIPSTHTQAWNASEGGGEGGDVDDDFYDPELDQQRYLPVNDSLKMVGDGYFGVGSSYFTAMFPGMFVLAANDINITEFSIVGDIGSDGDGVDATEMFPINAGGSAYAAFFKTNYDAGDPSINHIVIVDGSGEGISHYYDPTSEGDEHAVVGLAGKTKLFFICIGKESGDAMSRAEAEAIAIKFLEVAIGCSESTYEIDLSPDNPDAIPNYKYNGEGNMDTAIIQEGGKRISIQRSGYIEATDSCGNRKIISVKDGQEISVVPQTWLDAVSSIVKPS